MGTEVNVYKVAQAAMTPATMGTGADRIGAFNYVYRGSIKDSVNNYIQLAREDSFTTGLDMARRRAFKWWGSEMATPITLYWSPKAMEDNLRRYFKHQYDYLDPIPVSVYEGHTNIHIMAYKKLIDLYAYNGGTNTLTMGDGSKVSISSMEISVDPNYVSHLVTTYYDKERLVKESTYDPVFVDRVYVNHPTGVFELEALELPELTYYPAVNHKEESTYRDYSIYLSIRGYEESGRWYTKKVTSAAYPSGIEHGGKYLHTTLDGIENNPQILSDYTYASGYDGNDLHIKGYKEIEVEATEALDIDGNSLGIVMATSIIDDTFEDVQIRVVSVTPTMRTYLFTYVYPEDITVNLDDMLDDYIGLTIDPELNQYFGVPSTTVEIVEQNDVLAIYVEESGLLHYFKTKKDMSQNSYLKALLIKYRGAVEEYPHITLVKDGVTTKEYYKDRDPVRYKRLRMLAKLLGYDLNKQSKEVLELNNKSSKTSTTVNDATMFFAVPLFAVHKNQIMYLCEYLLNFDTKMAHLPLEYVTPPSFNLPSISVTTPSYTEVYDSDVIKFLMERGGEAITHSIPEGFKINRYIPNPQNLIPVRKYSSTYNNFIGDLYGYKVKVVEGVIGAIKTTYKGEQNHYYAKSVRVVYTGRDNDRKELRQSYTYLCSTMLYRYQNTATTYIELEVMAGNRKEAVIPLDYSIRHKFPFRLREVVYNLSIYNYLHYTTRRKTSFWESALGFMLLFVIIVALLVAQQYGLAFMLAAAYGATVFFIITTIIKTMVLFYIQQIAAANMSGKLLRLIRIIMAVYAVFSGFHAVLANLATSTFLLYANVITFVSSVGNMYSAFVDAKLSEKQDKFRKDAVKRQEKMEALLAKDAELFPSTRAEVWKTADTAMDTGFIRLGETLEGLMYRVLDVNKGYEVFNYANEYVEMSLELPSAEQTIENISLKRKLENERN